MTKLHTEKFITKDQAAAVYCKNGQFIARMGNFAFEDKTMKRIQFFILNDDSEVTMSSDIVTERFDYAKRECLSDWTHMLVEEDDGTLTAYRSSGPDSSPFWSTLERGFNGWKLTFSPAN